MNLNYLFRTSRLANLTNEKKDNLTKFRHYKNAIVVFLSIYLFLAILFPPGINVISLLRLCACVCVVHTTWNFFSIFIAISLFYPSLNAFLHESFIPLQKMSNVIFFWKNKRLDRSSARSTQHTGEKISRLTALFKLVSVFPSFAGEIPRFIGQVWHFHTYFRWLEITKRFAFATSGAVDDKR